MGLVVGAILMLVAVMFLIAIPKFRSMQTLVDKLNLVTREFVSGLMVIRAFNTQKAAEDKFDVANKELTAVSLSHPKLGSATFARPFWDFWSGSSSLARCEARGRFRIKSFRL